MVKLQNVLRFSQQFQKLLGAKGGSVASAANETISATLPMHDPAQAELRVLRSEKLWGIGALIPVPSTNGGYSVVVTNSAGNTILSVITRVRLTLYTPTPAAGSFLLASASNATFLSATGVPLPLDARAVGIASRASAALAAPGTTAFPAVYEDYVSWTANTNPLILVDVPSLPVILKPGQGAQFTLAWDIVLAVAAKGSFQVYGYERPYDPGELMLDGNAL